jgi:glycine/D-amino acid oxidase-like deaminating enzyme
MAARSHPAYDVAVIGAGTTGSAIAYFLTQRGLRPVVFEKTRAAGGPSGASAGMCRAHYAQPAIIDMARWGCEFLADMKARTGFQSGYSMSGYLVVAPPERETAMRLTYETMRERGVDVELCGVDRIRELEPRLATADLAVGSYEPTGGHAQPLFVADGFVRAAERDGATLRLGTRVTALRPDGQGWSLWLGDGTRASAEVVIVACGPWANKLTRGLGGVVPLALSRGQAGRFRPRHAFGGPGPIISDHVQELWIKPEGSDGHYLVGGRGGRLDRTPHQRPTGQAGADDATLETFAAELARRFPGMAGGVWRGSWSSFYDFTPDGNPVIDQIPGHPNLITATGMSGHCFKLAPSLGLGVSELVIDGLVRSFDWSVFAYGRFARRGDRVGGGRGPG